MFREMAVFYSVSWQYITSTYSELIFLLKLQEPEALTTSGRLEVQNYKPHDDRYLQPAGGSQVTPTERGQDHRLMHL